VIVDCVGVCEQELQDSQPLERKRTVPFERLLRAVAFGSTDPDVLSSLAGRLARLDQQLSQPYRQALAEVAGGATLQAITRGLVDAVDPQRQIEAARAAAGLPPDAEPTPAQVAQAAQALLRDATAPLATKPALREHLVALRQRFEQVVDTLSKDVVLEATYSEAARDRARETVESFERFLRDHRDEITALQLLYSRPYRRRLSYRDVKALAEAIKAPPRSWTPEGLWRAYETLDASRVRGSGRRMLTDVVALVRFALHQEDELVPFREQVEARFEAWLAQQESLGRRFTDEQRRWLEDIRDHIAASMAIELEDFDETPFAQRGGAGRAYQVFGNELKPVLDELNEALVA
jgi:type I restriction enzyme R subunit